MGTRYQLNDFIQGQFIRLPLALLANPVYHSMSLEAKVIYSLLLDRLSLSQKHNWMNEKGEVFIIFTRKEAESLLNICHSKTVSSFKELVQHGLISEERCGRNTPNRIYVHKTDLSMEDASSFQEKGRTRKALHKENAPSYEEKADEQDGSKEENDGKKIENQEIFPTYENQTTPAVPRPHPQPAFELQTQRDLKCKPREVCNSDAIQTDRIQTELSKTYVSRSIRARARECREEEPMEGETDGEHKLQQIFNQSELYGSSPVSGKPLFSPDERRILSCVIQKLFYSSSFLLKDTRYPRSIVRERLSHLNGEILRQAMDVLHENIEAVQSRVQYAAAVLLNQIDENELHGIGYYSGISKNQEDFPT